MTGRLTQTVNKSVDVCSSEWGCIMASKEHCRPSCAVKVTWEGQNFTANLQRDITQRSETAAKEPTIVQLICGIDYTRPCTGHGRLR